MLTKLTLNNFQPHHKKTIEFDLVTIITGPSDVGKSSLIRAIRWIAKNRPSGDGFITVGKENTRAKIVIDGYRISRAKGKKKGNYYQVDNRKLKAMGSKVPEAIENILCVSDLNFQLPRDPLFWFSLSPGQISKELNRIINLEAIDSSLSSVSSRLRKARSVVEVTESRLSTAKEKREETKWAVEADKDLKHVEELFSDAQKKEEHHQTLDEWIESCKAQKTKSVNLQKAAKEGEVVIAAVEAAAQINDKVSRLLHLLKSASEQEKEKCQAKEKLKRAEEKLHKSLKGRCPLCGRKM